MREGKRCLRVVFKLSQKNILQMHEPSKIELPCANASIKKKRMCFNSQATHFQTITQRFVPSQNLLALQTLVKNGKI